MTAWHASLFTGLFTRFGPMTPRPHDPDFALCSGEVAGGGTASGIGWDQTAADGACVGEAIERLQAAPLPDDEVVTASYADWPRAESAIDPAAWVLFHEQQYRQPGFPFQPLTRETNCAWVAYRKAQTGERIWIPTDLAYLQMPSTHRICPGYSTGLAAGRVGDPVLLRGLQEVVERDAVVGAWWGCYPLEEYGAADAFRLLGSEVQFRALRPNLRYRFLRIDTPFSAHATVVTLEGEDREGLCFSIGSSCRETRRESWMKSLLEAIHGRHYVCYLKTQIAGGAITLTQAPRTFAEHAVWYSVHSELLPTTVLTKPNDRSESQSPEAPETVARLMRRLGADRPVLFRSMTPPALAAEKLGWQVVRVVVPGLQPMHGDHTLPHLGGPLWAPRGLADWTDMPPHPFP